MKKIIRYGSHYLNSEDIKRVTRSLNSNSITQGLEIKNYENLLCKYFGSKYAVALSSGTAALHLGIKSFRLKKGLKVITSPITFIATASSILMNDLIPEFADINSKTYTLDPNFVEDKIKKDKKIKVIIGVDYAGHPCDWEAFKYLKEKYGLYLINDNCHSMGSKYYGKKDYAIKFADIVTQSYHAVKNITTGEGGAVLTQRKKISDFILNQRSHGMIKNSYLKINKGLWYYNVYDLGYNYRITDFQCALGSSQLSKLNKFVKKRRLLSNFYNRSFGDYKDLFTIPNVNEKKYFHSFHLYPLLVNFNKLKIDKKSFFKKMLKKGFSLQVHYIPLYKQPFLKKIIDKGKYPFSEEFYSKEVSLPIYFNLKKQDQKNLINKIFETLKIRNIY